jgi:hypothetical protein
MKNKVQTTKFLHPFIFTKKTNINYKLIPFNVSVNDTNKTKYLPPVSKEWKNNIYNYNYKNSINLPIYDININTLIKGYFSLYFKNKFIKSKYLSARKRRKSFNKIYVSRAEVKHTNNKAIVTIYVFNKERLVLLARIRELRKQFSKFPLVLLNYWNNVGSVLDLSTFLKFGLKNAVAKFLNLRFKKSKVNQVISRNKSLIEIKQNLSTIRRLRLRLSLNNYKFEEKFLSRLSLLISKYYRKKVEFNIVNLKSLGNNNDIFTQVLVSKLKVEQSSPVKRMDSLLARVVLPDINVISERGRIEKQVDYKLVQNRYKNANINYIIDSLNQTVSNTHNSLNELLYNLYYNLSADSSTQKESYIQKLREIIFNNIKYKSMSGARLVVKGRLTRRYRADRALYKFKWKGGLKNIDSAYKGLSSVVFRGYLDANVEKSVLSSKRRIGSFGVKSWLSGK